MQNRKNTRNWAIAGAVAMMLAGTTAGVRAQDATTTPPATTTPESPMPSTSTSPGTSAPTTSGMSGNMSSDSMSGSMSGGMAGNYTLLSNPHYDYIDLQQAKARGLSDSQIATVSKISKKTGMPFRMVSAAVERGETFPSLATQYNLRLGDVYENETEKQEIADYTAAYESAGLKTSKNGGMMGEPMVNSGMSSGNMTPMPGTMTDSGSNTSASPTMSANMATMDIVDTAMAAKNLTTLVKALQVAGLVETLKGAGPFTVFAPDDKAFSKLPAGQLDALLADPVKLKTILTYHVIPASVMAADASAMTSPTSPPTVEGGTLQVTKGNRGRLKINEATVTKADIKASNGVIHIIDQVLMPPMDAATPATGTDTTTTPPATGTGATPPAAGTDTTAPPPAPAPAQ